jgi:hypothetical protein
MYFSGFQLAVRKLSFFELKFGFSLSVNLIEAVDEVAVGEGA